MVIIWLCVMLDGREELFFNRYVCTVLFLQENTVIFSEKDEVGRVIKAEALTSLSAVRGQWKSFGYGHSAQLYS